MSKPKKFKYNQKLNILTSDTCGGDFGSGTEVVECATRFEVSVGVKADVVLARSDKLGRTPDANFGTAEVRV